MEGWFCVCGRSTQITSFLVGWLHLAIYWCVLIVIPVTLTLKFFFLKKYSVSGKSTRTYCWYSVCCKFCVTPFYESVVPMSLLSEKIMKEIVFDTTVKNIDWWYGMLFLNECIGCPSRELRVEIFDVLAPLQPISYTTIILHNWSSSSWKYIVSMHLIICVFVDLKLFYFREMHPSFAEALLFYVRQYPL